MPHSYDIQHVKSKLAVPSAAIIATGLESLKATKSRLLYSTEKLANIKNVENATNARHVTLWFLR